MLRYSFYQSSINNISSLKLRKKIFLQRKCILTSLFSKVKKENSSKNVGTLKQLCMEIVTNLFK